MNRRRAFVVSVSAASLMACAERTPAQGPPPNEPVTSVNVDDSAPDVTAAAPEATASPVAPESTLQPKAGDEPLQLRDFPEVQNPQNKNGRTIFPAWSGPGCYVELDFPPLKPGEQRPPGTAPPTQTEPCPPELADAAYQACRGGTIRRHAERAECICFVMGNPPPPATRIDCPTK